MSYPDPFHPDQGKPPRGFWWLLAVACLAVAAAVVLASAKLGGHR